MTRHQLVKWRDRAAWYCAALTHPKRQGKGADYDKRLVAALRAKRESVAALALRPR